MGQQLNAAALHLFRKNEARLERYPSMYVLRHTRRSSGAADGESASSNSTPPDAVEAEAQNPNPTAEQAPAGEEALAADA